MPNPHFEELAGAFAELSVGDLVSPESRQTRFKQIAQVLSTMAEGTQFGWYETLAGEVGVINNFYTWGNFRRYGGDVTASGSMNKMALENAIRSMYEIALSSGVLVGGKVVVPEGLYALAPSVISHSCRLVFERGAQLQPVFTSNTVERLIRSTADDVHVEGMRVKTVFGIISATKYLLLNDGGARFRVCDFNAEDITLSDGNSGLTNLIVTHAIYSDGGSDVEIENCNVNVLSGAAVFCRNVIGLLIRRCHLTDTRWYSINLDSGCEDYIITLCTIDGNDSLTRYWGGSINLMSQIGGTRNKRGKVIQNKISGIHNYGAAIRMLSTEGCEVAFNQVFDVESGTLLSGPMQYIGMDRRGTVEGSPENGPCSDVNIHHNTLTAKNGPHQAIYIKNQYLATRDPHRNIKVQHNDIVSPSIVDYFEVAVSVHGFKSGFDGLRIEHNTATVMTGLGAPVGGAIGLVSTNSDGLIANYRVVENDLRDITPVAPVNSSQIGLYIQGTSEYGLIHWNRFDKFFYGFRTELGGTNFYGLAEQIYRNCINDTLFNH